MNTADLFVGGVTILLGLAALATALLNWEAGFRLPKAQAMENRFGRRGARAIIAVLGLLLIALGGAIVAGFRPNAPQRGSRRATVRPCPLCLCLIGPPAARLQRPGPEVS